MALNYKLNATISPASGSSGTTVKMTATLTDVEGEVAGVYASVTGQGMQFRLMKQEDGSYSASTSVPWGAPSGGYSVAVFAMDNDRQRGPEKSVQFTVM